MTTTTMTTDDACYILRRRAKDDAGLGLRREAVRTLKAAGWPLTWIEQGALRLLDRFEYLTYEDA